MTSTTRPQPSSSPSPRPFSQAAPSSQATRLGEASNKFRASIGVPTDNTRWGPPSSNGGGGNNSNQNNNFRGVSPGRASTGGGGNGQAGGGQRPGSEAMGMSLGGMGMNQSQGVFHSAESESQFSLHLHESTLITRLRDSRSCSAEGKFDVVSRKEEVAE